jgi:hypothetical protein
MIRDLKPSFVPSRWPPLRHSRSASSPPVAAGLTASPFSTDVLRKEFRSVLEEILGQTAVDATT